MTSICRGKNRTLKFFLKNSSLHGMKYVGDEKKHWCERLLWFTLLVIFAVISFKTLRARWILWKDSPMIITTVNKPYSISSLPVPAITYCQDFLVPSASTNFTNLTKEEKIIRCLILNSLASRELNKCIDVLRGVESDVKIDAGTLFKMIDELLIMDKSYLRNESNGTPMLGQRFDEPISCFEMLTHQGLCITCNALPLSQIYKNNTILHYFRNNPDDYNLVGQVNGFPLLNSSRFNLLYPSLVKRPMNGVTMNDLQKLENKSVKILQRLKWYTIHSPWDVPNFFMRWHYSKEFRKRELQVFIEPDQTLIDDDLNISPASSQCYTPHEKQLEFFKYYTHQNCKMECLTREVLKLCGCVMYYMPHNDSTNICLKSYCTNRIVDDIDELGSLECDCPSSCNHTDYKFVSHDTIPDSDTSKLITVFIDDRFYPQIRRESGTIEGFIETSVTYLDMFLGLSLITIVEILYYSVLMLLECFNVEQFGFED